MPAPVSATSTHTLGPSTPVLMVMVLGIGVQFANGVAAHLADDTAKAFGTASTLADHRWLFTGKNAGAHLQPPSLMARMSRLGITARARRNTALLHLASTTPPAIFANLIGVNIGTVTRWAGLAGATWNSYATTPRCQDANKRMAPKDR